MNAKEKSAVRSARRLISKLFMETEMFHMEDFLEYEQKMFGVINRVAIEFDCISATRIYDVLADWDTFYCEKSIN